MLVRIKKLNDKAVMPFKAHPTDAGSDLVATSKEMDIYGNIVYGTGLAFEIPEGHVGLLFPRSSNSKQDLVLTNSVGVVDAHYRGEVMLKFRPDNRWWQSAKSYDVGDRVAQIIILPFPSIDWDWSDTLSETDRGEGGYGSSGR